MIEIKNVTKVYKVKRRNDVVALNDVTFDLPDKGMVFIVGKSGSGKSTLLNIIGGLDSATKGEIIADGNSILKMSKTKLTKYRSSYVGFIFQDYHILENFTVRQNIELAMDIANKNDENKINEILQVVDLSIYADRYPSELSGGQKQRVSIARALVKDAQVILCDEPTGNLDKKTSNQVLDMLKKISQEKLVVVVSHNMVDANTYADRIIELYDGTIVRDRQRTKNYNNEFKIENNTIYLPHYNDLTPNELILVNESIQSNEGELKFKQIDNRFIQTGKIVNNGDKFNIHAKVIKKKTSKKLYKMFFRHKKAGVVFSILLASLLMVCFAIFQSFLEFDGNKELSKSLQSHNILSVPLQKGVADDAGNVSLSYIKSVEEEDEKAFRDSGYKGNIFYKYNCTLPISVTSSTSTIDNENSLAVTSNLKMFYTKETFGVINCNEEFVKKSFGIDGNINYLALSDDPKEYGIYIPDYVADSIIFHSIKKDTTYEDLLGSFYKNGNVKFQTNYINGIFDTNYETKYKDLLDKFNEVSEDPENAGKVYNEIKESDIFIDFTMFCMNFLAYGYNFSTNYEEAIYNNDFRNWLNLNEIYVESTEENKTFLSYTYTFYHDEGLKDNEIIVSLATYNKWFGTNYQTFDELPSKEIKLTFTEGRSSTGKTTYEKTFKVIGTRAGNVHYVNLNNCQELRQYDIIKYGMYLDSQDNIGDVIDIATKQKYVICSTDATKLSTINRVLNIFGKFFYFIEVFFLLVTVIFLVNIGLSSIKKNKYEIGVLRAIGTLSFDIVRIFIRQSIIVCFLILIVANIGIYVGTFVANNILVTAFEAILDMKFNELRLINYLPRIVFTDLIYIAGVSFLSFIIPQIFLFRIKPIEIIRARE